MKVDLRPIGIIRNYTRETLIEVSDDGCLIDVIRSINIPAEIRPVFLVNNKRCGFDKKLSDGDEIKIVSVIMGG